jgi:hypothetical protein
VKACIEREEEVKTKGVGEGGIHRGPLCELMCFLPRTNVSTSGFGDFIILFNG